MSNIVALDVETADSWVGSICQIGIAGYENHQLVKFSTYINPECAFAVPQRTVHGINAAMVVNSPTISEFWPRLLSMVAGRLVVIYTDFDARALLSAAAAHGLSSPDCIWIDAYGLAQDAWPELGNHKLRTVGASLGISFSEMHDAGQDALAAAYIALKARAALRLSDAEMIDIYSLDQVRVSPPVRRASVAKPPVGAGWAAVLEAAKGAPPALAGQCIVFTGDLPFDRAAMAARLTPYGCKVVASVTSKTTLIVSGWETPAAGGQKMKSAADRILDGQSIIFMTGEEFIAWVDRLA